MIDVSRFRIGDACPRCVDRRVYAVEQDRDLWLCIANAMPIPWRRDQVTEHDARDETSTPSEAAAVMRAIATLPSNPGPQVTR